MIQIHTIDQINKIEVTDKNLWEVVCNAVVKCQRQGPVYCT